MKQVAEGDATHAVKLKGTQAGSGFQLYTLGNLDVDWKAPSGEGQKKTVD